MPRYKYLFPFECVPRNSNVIIYGAGDVGREYFVQLELSGYGKVVAMLDQNWDKYAKTVVPVYPPERICELSYDYVVIAIKSDVYLRDILDKMLKLRVEKERIIFTGLRGKEPRFMLFEEKVGDFDENELAFRKATVSLALKFGPGFGDALIKKPFFEQLVKQLPGIQVDVYSSLSETLFQSIYHGTKGLNCYIRDAGAAYLELREKYTIAIQAPYLLQVDKVDDSAIRSVDVKSSELLQRLVDACKKYNLDLSPVELNYVHFKRMEMRGEKCWQLFNYAQAFIVRDWHVKIPLIKEYELNFRALGLKRYITLNYGNGNSVAGRKSLSAKQWPLEYFNEFVSAFKLKYPNIEVVQIGGVDTEQITGVDRIFLGKNMELVKYILRGALLHLDIEGGLVHLATQLGTRCVVLFGPTPASIFAYPCNVNLVNEKCNDCWFLYGESFACARGLDKPECVYSLKPNMVLKRVEEALTL